MLPQIGSCNKNGNNFSLSKQEIVCTEIEVEGCQGKGRARKVAETIENDIKPKQSSP